MILFKIQLKNRIILCKNVSKIMNEKKCKRATIILAVSLLSQFQFLVRVYLMAILRGLSDGC